MGVGTRLARQFPRQTAFGVESADTHSGFLEISLPGRAGQNVDLETGMVAVFVEREQMAIVVKGPVEIVR
jgi:hypothetical protein